MAPHELRARHAQPRLGRRDHPRHPGRVHGAEQVVPFVSESRRADACGYAAIQASGKGVRGLDGQPEGGSGLVGDVAGNVATLRLLRPDLVQERRHLVGGPRDQHSAGVGEDQHLVDARAAERLAPAPAAAVAVALLLQPTAACEYGRPRPSGEGHAAYDV